MTKARFFLFCLVATFAFLACTPPATAQSKIHHHVKLIPRAPQANPEVTSDVLPAANLYGIEQAFVATSAPFTLNSDGSEIWPCFGDGSGTGDCPFIGDPQQNFPAGGVASGGGSYSWSLTACNQNTPSVAPCGQTETWYEDDTADTTEDLLYTITATQGTGAGLKYIADSGTVDLVSPNPFGGPASPPADVIIYGDQGFGTQGTAAGPNNGNCEANFGYPLTSNANPGGTYVVAAGKTCVAPVSGLVTITATTETAVPTYHKQTTVAKCGSVPIPCYTVTYAKKHSVIQKWEIWLD